ncbi:hypothetical protein ACFZBU_41205 [Embleya sp. NPDC008237]|uniref:hypothetical protein n=1 Tax=Embleya sp. NPDC008237 TaxID=3363978 RepID=UPI0036E1816F
MAALDAGAPLPPPFDDPGEAWRRLFEDPNVPRTTITLPDDTTHNALRQAFALPALFGAAEQDSLQAVLDALCAATLSHGTGQTGASERGTSQDRCSAWLIRRCPSPRPRQPPAIVGRDRPGAGMVDPRKSGSPSGHQPFWKGSIPLSLVSASQLLRHLMTSVLPFRSSRCSLVSPDQ